jgi:hypothetical protein
MAGAFMLKIGQTSGDGICPALPPPLPRRRPPGTFAHGQLTERTNPWQSVSQVSAVLTAFVQSAGLLAGMYYIEKVSAAHPPSPASRPYLQTLPPNPQNPQASTLKLKPDTRHPINLHPTS